MEEQYHNLQIARKAAQAGAGVVSEHFGRSHEMRIKPGSKTLVTETDTASEAAILNVLNDHSGYGILSEECGLIGPKDGPLWIVDPLDGTSNFARSLPLFAISVALVDGAEILAGVIIDPVNGKEYYATKNGGAWCNGIRLNRQDRGKIVPALFLNHGPRQEDKERFAGLAKIFSSVYSLRKLGTTALELCYVAAGTFDGFICTGDSIWDYAAGVLIAREAGCLFTDWNGREWDGESNYILVSDPEIHATILERITSLQ